MCWSRWGHGAAGVFALSESWPLFIAQVRVTLLILVVHISSAIPSMVSHTHSARANGVDQVGVGNEHHMLLECSHGALAVIRSEHRTLFDGINDVRTLMTAAYKPDLAPALHLHCRPS